MSLAMPCPYVDVLMLPFLSNSWDKVFKFVNSKAGDEFLKGVENLRVQGLRLQRIWFIRPGNDFQGFDPGTVSKNEIPCP
jgi:TRAP-type C4-dicarboxylate transport system substrate-binding protein